MSCEEKCNDLSNRLDGIEEKLDKIIEAFVGDPADTTKPGFTVRIDRLEQSNKTKNTILYLLGTGLMTIIGALIQDWFHVIS